MTIINDLRMSCVTVGVALLYDHEHREWVKICIPSPVMVTSPYEWKILEWDENPEQKKNRVHYYGTVKFWFTMEKIWFNSENYETLIYYG